MSNTQAYNAAATEVIKEVDAAAAQLKTRFGQSAEQAFQRNISNFSRAARRTDDGHRLDAAATTATTDQAFDGRAASSDLAYRDGEGFRLRGHVDKQQHETDSAKRAAIDERRNKIVSMIKAESPTITQAKVQQPQTPEAQHKPQKQAAFSAPAFGIAA